jgi:hypothetical protein
MDPLPLTPAQEHVLALLSAGSTVTAAAKSAGIHRNTIANWRGSSPAFLDAYNQAVTEKALVWREQSEQLAAAAIDVLRTLLTDPATPPGVRLKAALVILEKVTTPTVFSASAASPRSLREPTELTNHPTPEIVHNSAQSAQITKTNPTKTGRNDPCPCHSGRKFKHCCLGHPHVAGPGTAAA